MENLSTLLQMQSHNAWLFIPSAILLGALHGLEPGHSKTMMAAFIIAIRGTVGQAVMLGLAATVSHTTVVWLVALLGLHFGGHWNAATSEPWFQIGSAILIIGIAGWMMWRTWHERRTPHSHDHDHAHQHPPAMPGNSPYRRLQPAHAHDHGHPHDHGHDHGHTHHPMLAFAALDGAHHDAHAAAHAHDIRKRFAEREVTNGQILMFGLTGGLIPCPASITVLLLCLQLKQFSLGMTLVLCFSLGLAITLVASGVIAAVSVRQIAQRWSGFGELAHRAPYFSGSLISLVGLYMGYQGAHALL